MRFSRRSFFRVSGMAAGSALTGSLIQARGLEAWRMGLRQPPAPDGGQIILDSNENPIGPGQTVLNALRSALGPDGSWPGRYPGSYEDPLAEAVAHKLGVQPENILVGCGSTQILVTATQVYTSKDRPLVGSMPTYEECAGYAAVIGSPVKAVPLDAGCRMDLEHTLHAAQGAGLVFFCNPNNPSATMVTAEQTKDFVRRLLKRSPQTRVLVDEAYIDYVTQPGHESMVSLALDDPRVVVARTFSKIYGMAGLRVGYAVAHADTIKEMAAWHAGNTISGLSFAAAIAAIGQDASYLETERARNRKVRDFAADFFTRAGCDVTESQTNFLFVNVGMPVGQFQAACRARGVLVGRPFPPLWSHSRISLGTMEEMQQATRILTEVLRSRDSHPDYRN